MDQYADRDTTRTIRQRIIDLLIEHQLTARELSQAIGIREREVYGHLAHVARSTAAQDKRLIVHPAQCLVCGYVFENRRRLTRPSRCPRCRHSHLQEPSYQIA
jgi:predicted Zn-ribbon and HTH transcriptional regulator